jgi:DNA-binding NtrC family response regulator
MKTFKVYLRDGRSAVVHADTYRHQGNRYVFDRAGSSEVQFFIDSEVVGISEATDHARETVLPEQSDGSLLSRAEQDLIIRTLAECGGNRTATARKLGISRRGLTYKLQSIPRDRLSQ